MLFQGFGLGSQLKSSTKVLPKAGSKIKNACSDFLTEKSKTPSLKKRKVSEKTETYSTKLNNELTGNVEI